MKILFYPADLPPWHANSLEERPMSGGPVSIIRLAAALQELGNDVTVATSYAPVLPAALAVPSQPRYLHYTKLNELGPADVAIVLRKWEGVFYCPAAAKKTFYWTGQAMSNPKMMGIGDKRVIQALDGLLFQSQWQRETTCEASNFPKEKTWVLPLGVHLSDFEGKEKRHRKRLIYASLPSRGLKHMVNVYKALKPIHPELEIFIFSSFDRAAMQYSSSSPEDAKYKELFGQLAALPGCHLHKSIKQRQLAREMMKSAIWAYPSNFQETCCGVAFEVQAAGCASVVSDLAALPEAVGDAGLLIPYSSKGEAFMTKFIEAVDTLLTDDRLLDHFSQRALARARDFSWKNRGLSLMKYLNDEHGIK